MKSNLHRHLEQKLRNKRLVLRSISDLTNADDLKEPFLAVNEMYSSSDPITRVTATYLNSVYTESKPVHSFSKKALNDLLSNDPRAQRRDLNNNEYKAFKAQLLGTGIIRELVPARKSERDRKAGLYQITDEELLKHFINPNNEAELVREYFKWQRYTLDETQFPNIFPSKIEANDELNIKSVQLPIPDPDDEEVQPSNTDESVSPSFSELYLGNNYGEHVVTETHEPESVRSQTRALGWGRPRITPKQT